MLVVECESDSDEKLIDSEESGDCEEDMNFAAYLFMHIYNIFRALLSPHEQKSRTT